MVGNFFDHSHLKGTVKYELKCQKPENSKKWTISCRVMYFNLPYSKSVKTNVIRSFLRLINKLFPRNHSLHKCFNRNTVKATNCTQLTNMKQKIAAHNAKILNRAKEEQTGCNCRNKKLCPILGKCNQTNKVYQAIVVTHNKSMFYLRSTEKFKPRYAQHKLSFNHRPANHTILSSYNWKLKDSHAPYTIEWAIISCGHTF